MDKLLELAERCEQADAESQSDKLEEAFRMIDPAPRRMYSNTTRLLTTKRWAEWSHRYDLFAEKLACEAFLDAAMTLVPKGIVTRRVLFIDGKCRLSMFDAHNLGQTAIAATEPLALCAAALRARQRHDG
jgi:hypothetical protein